MQAYIAKCRVMHPDMFMDKPANEREAAQKKFVTLSNAFKVLSNAQTRASYDATIGACNVISCSIVCVDVSPH